MAGTLLFSGMLVVSLPSKDVGVVFLHPMKTATTSVARFLCGELDKTQRENHHFEGHETPQELMWRMRWEEDWFEKRFCVLFVRNPYDRLVSFYHHMRQLGGHARGLCLRKSFSEFLQEDRLIEIVKPLSSYLQCGGKEIVTFLGRYESLDDDVNKLIDALGFAVPEDIKRGWREAERCMKTEHAPYETYYNEKHKEIVFERFKEDFLLFDYRR